MKPTVSWPTSTAGAKVTMEWGSGDAEAELDYWESAVPNIQDLKRACKRKYNMDLDILECPICFERFSPPVYQCHNGHTACSSCCKKLANKKCPTCKLATGSIRCVAIEKVLESLQVRCKHARHGCEEMVNESDIGEHEEWCTFEPFQCPSLGCIFEGSGATLRLHLTEKHRVKTVALNRISGAGFVSKFSDYFILLKCDQDDDHEDGDRDGEPLLYLMHRAAHEADSSVYGHVFFCTTFGGAAPKYSLKATLHVDPSMSVSITGAHPKDLRRLGDYMSGDFLCLPSKRLGKTQRHVNLHLTLDRS